MQASRRACAARLLSAGRDAPAALRCAGGVASPPEEVASAVATSPSVPATPPPERSSGRTTPLYDGHIRLSAPQRAAVAVGAAVGALWSPARADLVAALGCVPLALATAFLHALTPRRRRETTGHAALERMRRRMAADPEGIAILADRPRITDATLEACWAMPPGALL
jgi:hypothetical protein